MKTIIAMITAALLSGCASFKAPQFGACIVTGKAACVIRMDGPAEQPEAPATRPPVGVSA